MAALAVHVKTIVIVREQTQNAAQIQRVYVMLGTVKWTPYVSKVSIFNAHELESK